MGPAAETVALVPSAEAGGVSVVGTAVPGGSPALPSTAAVFSVRAPKSIFRSRAIVVSLLPTNSAT